MVKILSKLYDKEIALCYYSVRYNLYLYASTRYPRYCSTAWMEYIPLPADVVTLVKAEWKKITDAAGKPLM